MVILQRSALCTEK